MTSWVWRLRVLGAVVLTALAVAGCGVRTVVDVTARTGGDAAVTVAVEFTGEVADLLQQQPDLLAELTATVQSRTETTPHVRTDQGAVHVVADVPVDVLTQSGAVTGVSQVEVTEHGDLTQVAVELRDVPELLTAIEQATANQPDAGAVAATMADTTELVVQVTFPGKLSEPPATVGIRNDQLNVDERTVTVTRTASQAATGAVLVVGNPVAPFNWTWVVLGGAAAAAAGAVVWAVRRDRDGPTSW